MSKTTNRVRCNSSLGAKFVWEIAEDLGCSESQVVALIGDGKLRARRIGKRRLIVMPEDLKEFLEKARTNLAEEAVG